MVEKSDARGHRTLIEYGGGVFQELVRFTVFCQRLAVVIGDCRNLLIASYSWKCRQIQ